MKSRCVQEDRMAPKETDAGVAGADPDWAWLEGVAAGDGGVDLTGEEMERAVAAVGGWKPHEGEDGERIRSGTSYVVLYSSMCLPDGTF